jgi:hypothetical protein
VKHAVFDRAEGGVTAGAGITLGSAEILVELSVLGLATVPEVWRIPVELSVSVVYW